MKLYELKVHDRQHALDQNIILKHNDDSFSHEDIRKMTTHAEYEIEEFIEENYDDMNETMCDIADLYDDGFTLDAIADYLCEFNGFSRWYPSNKISIYID